MNGEMQAAANRAHKATPDWLLGCFQKVLGHELANQLVATQGLLRLLEFEEGQHLTSEGRDYLRRLSAGAERSHSLISGLADIISALRRVEPAQPVPLTETLHEVAAEVKQLFADRDPAFEFDILIPTLVVPPHGFRRVVSKLSQHAIQSTEQEHPQIVVRVVPSAAGVELRVTDNGPALSAEQVERLFDPSGGGSRDRLGLVLARTLVENWGGTIRAQAHAEGRNTLTVWLPSGP
jgi:signal transduction histidine kinase